MRNFGLNQCLITALWFAVPQHLEAQGTVNALNFIPPSILGYTNGGVGWTFVPTSDLLVTAISATAPQVSFWLGMNQIIANYNYFNSSRDPIYVFQPVTPLFLSAGQSYSISAQNPNFASTIVFYVFGPNPGGSPFGPAPFSVSAYISQFASYSVSDTGQWSPLATPPDNSSYLGFGPNFQFQVVPEPSWLGLLLLAASAWYYRRADPFSSSAQML